MSLIPFVGAVQKFNRDRGYRIERSLRFNSADSAYLNRTPAGSGTGAGKTWTWSGWVKRSKSTLLDLQMLLSASSSRSGFGFFTFSGGGTGSDSFSIYHGASFTTRVETTQVFRDFSSWYHIVVSVDTTQATAANRISIYVNGSKVTQFSTASYPAQNYQFGICEATAHNIGRDIGGGGYYFDGYLTETHLIDGQALTPSSFGGFNPTTGVWQPKKYTGTYGTNGFYLNFSDNSGTTSTTLGKDSSGNGNNWTPNNFSVTAGAGNDSLVDSPTRYGTDTGAGGEVRGNYATANPLQQGSFVTLSNGNLTVTGNTPTNSALALGTIGGLTSGKWYWEYTQGTVNSETCGIVTTYTPGTSLINGENIGAFGIGARAGGTVYGGTVGSITSWTTNDVIGLAVDCDNGAIYWSKNGTWLNSGVPTSGASKTGAVGTWTTSTASVTPAFGAYNGGFVNINFGQRPFSYTAPSGFKALVTTNLD